MLIELDRTPLPPTRTPLGHSIPAAATWSLVICTVASAISPGSIREAAIASLSAFSSHLAADAFTAEGIFLWPRALSPESWLAPYPPESVLEHGGRRFLMPTAAGALPTPWCGWRALSLSRLGDRSPALNAALSASGLAATAIAMAFS
ncbi:MAG: hypothetical protein QXW06_05500 [Thermoplasmata archaeon]